jgi:Ca2+-binding EF-hand superfamily protein
MARLFSRIDHDQKGYITMDDIHDYYERRAAARRQTDG